MFPCNRRTAVPVLDCVYTVTNPVLSDLNIFFTIHIIPEAFTHGIISWYWFSFKIPVDSQGNDDRIWLWRDQSISYSSLLTPNFLHAWSSALKIYCLVIFLKGHFDFINHFSAIRDYFDINYIVQLGALVVCVLKYEQCLASGYNKSIKNCNWKTRHLLKCIPLVWGKVSTFT